MKLIVAVTLLAAGALSTPSLAQVVDEGAVVRFMPSGPTAAPDFANAKALALPQSRVSPGSTLQLLQNAPATGALQSGLSSGSPGSGLTGAVNVPALKFVPTKDIASPEEYGSGGQVYTTSQVNPVNDTTTVKSYPFRAAGRLYFSISGSTYVCSASMIKPGVLLTAAHCVANYGKHQFYKGWTYVPALTGTTAPYGTWSAQGAWVTSSYYNGTDGCYQTGVVCPNDVAVILLARQNNVDVGTRTGWLGYGWGSYGYKSSQVQVAQLGYPVALDGGVQMERTDAQGVTNATFSNNTIIGSLQTGGSSGGPWVENLGTAPALNGTTFGTAALHNVVVGVTSWGYTNSAVKQMGAAPFTSSNIVTLVASACKARANACDATKK